MADKINGVDPSISNPHSPLKDQAPPDPSNTSSIGEKVEQGVIDIKGGLSEQSNEWEDKQERSIPEIKATDKAEDYLKNPSPEENKSDNE